MLVKATSREKICKGEEAVASRITTNAYPFNQAKGLVERKVSHLGTGAMRQLLYINCPTVRSESRLIATTRQSRRGEILSYHSLKIANAMFPENFQKVLGLRFNKDGTESCIYSEYVPDTTNTIARKTAGVQEYQDENEERRTAQRNRYDSIEHEMCPRLRTTHEKIEQAGIIVPRPEMNYHYDGKNVVFFEVCQVELDKLAGAILSMPEGSKKTKASVHFGILVAEMLRIRAENGQELPYSEELQIAQTFLKSDFARLAIDAATRTTFVVFGRETRYEAPPLPLYFKDAPNSNTSLYDGIYKMREGFETIFIRTVQYIDRDARA
ncbi:MAG: hypothetical protein WC861_02815 [Candidatus Micrarchaeia archaeon]|jgi:hypothetical protein